MRLGILFLIIAAGLAPSLSAQASEKALRARAHAVQKASRAQAYAIQKASRARASSRSAKQQTELNDANRKRLREILARMDKGLPVSSSERTFATRMIQAIGENPAASDLRAISAADRKRFDEIRSRRQNRLPISSEERGFFDKLSWQIARSGAAPAPPRPPQPAKAPAPPRPPLERSLSGPSGRWWATQTAQRIGITTEQQKKMDDIFQQHRLNLTDLTAAVQKEEITLEPLVSAEQPDEAKITAQIDRVAQARAELEKANARMLLGIRRVLTQEQWEKLKSQGTAAPR